MEPPPGVDLSSSARIQHLYSELPSIFAKEIARRQQSALASTAGSNMNAPNSSATLKRERSDDASVDLINKRRDTGSSKSPTMMPPPTSLPIAIQSNPNAQFAVPISNGPSQHSNHFMDPSQAGLSPGITSDAQAAAAARENARQAQIRAAQQQAARQMSPTSSLNGGGGTVTGFAPTVNASAGSSNLSAGGNANPNLSATGPSMQQMYQILQTPGHPFVQYMMQSVPGFQTMHLQAQIQKMLVAQVRSLFGFDIQDLPFCHRARCKTGSKISNTSRRHRHEDLPRIKCKGCRMAA